MAWLMRINVDLPLRLLHKILFFEILIVKGFHEGFAETKFVASMGFLMTSKLFSNCYICNFHSCVLALSGSGKFEGLFEPKVKMR